jgi:hypothetical protein
LLKINRIGFTWFQLISYEILFHMRNTCERI